MEARVGGDCNFFLFPFSFFCIFPFLFLIFFYYIYISLSACMPAGQKSAPDLITDGCEPQCGCRELNSGPLVEQAMLLTAEPSLQPCLFLFFSFPFFVFPSFFLSFFFLSFFCCLLFQEMVSLCMLGCPKTHSVNQAVLELKEICVWAEIKGMHLLPHTTARQRLHFLVTSGCPGLILSGDGSVLWMFANPDYVLPFNVMSLKH